jgi:hypothetical protein
MFTSFRRSEWIHKIPENFKGCDPYEMITLQFGFPAYWLADWWLQVDSVAIEFSDYKITRITISTKLQERNKKWQSVSCSSWVCIAHWPLYPNSELYWTSLYGNRTKHGQKQKEHEDLKAITVAWKVERFIRGWLGTVVNRVERTQPPYQIFS